MNENVIVLAVCTFKRPEMLRRCLASVGRLIVPEGASLVICVVDNETSKATEALVREVSAGHVCYLPQPERGIVHARNMALDWAIDQSADWIVFLDDDQTVSEGWLTALVSAQEKTGAEVIQSAVKYISPEGHTLKKAKASWNWKLKYVSTNGVLFSSRLVRPEGLGLRFDPRFNLSGCSDRFLFLQAVHEGVHCVATPEAIAIELTPETRIGLMASFQRRYKQNWINSYQDVDLYGYFGALKQIALKAVSEFYKGILSLVLGLFVFLFSRKYGRRKLHKAARNFGTIFGAVRGLFAKELPQAYLRTHGG